MKPNGRVYFFNVNIFDPLANTFKKNNDPYKYHASVNAELSIENTQFWTKQFRPPSFLVHRKRCIFPQESDATSRKK